MEAEITRTMAIVGVVVAGSADVEGGMEVIFCSHMGPYAPHFQPPQAGQQYGQPFYGAPRGPFHPGNSGHSAFTCPHFVGSSTPALAAIPSGESNAPVWYPDSDASAHMTPHEVSGRI
ncbi:unnamed protein product [Cuscuta europaea]|uniref:Uncharacterized protein n=1 Tax=Cuscuta europaea TaxID=41803 RepID=A0A9P1ENN9_CUSEU|nr:unnamed protein product [Cuscuta europaea]